MNIFSLIGAGIAGLCRRKDLCIIRYVMAYEDGRVIEVADADALLQLCLAAASNHIRETDDLFLDSSQKRMVETIVRTKYEIRLQQIEEYGHRVTRNKRRASYQCALCVHETEIRLQLPRARGRQPDDL